MIRRLPLSRDEFASAIQKGLGRAFLHLQAYGDDGVVDLLARACTENLAYDGQCESDRGHWLHGLIQLVDRAPYRLAILEASSKPQEDTWTARQLCELLQHFAAEGDAEARSALLGFLDTDDTSPWLGVEEIIIGLGGFEGVRVLAERFGSVTRAGEDVNEYPFEVACYQLGREAVVAFLEREAEGNEHVATYLCGLREAGELDEPEPASPMRPRRIRIGDLDAILSSGKLSHATTVRFRSFGRRATQRQLWAAFERLLVARDRQDREALRHWLRVFETRPLPELTEDLWQTLWALLDSSELEEGGLFYEAVEVLSHLDDPRLRERAKAWLEDGELRFVGPAIDLLKPSFRSGDGVLVSSALRLWRQHDRPETAGEDELHRIHCAGLSLLDLTRRHRDEGLANSLHWLYERGPCSICRSEAVERLIAWSALPEPFGDECRYDSDRDTRALVGGRGDWSGT